jgi:tRNA(Ile)-lysidine synthase
MLLKRFKDFIDHKKLLAPSNKLLLAVSGGIDSMVLLDLCLQAGYDVEVAHCNFKLRGTESDADEQLVAEVCNAHRIKLHSISFETAQYAIEKGLSIQMAARTLRYDYFNQLVVAHGFNKLLTAHHADDNIETFFINLLRSTGIDGLTGISLQNGNIIRPLLFANKKEIAAYAVEHHIRYRDDSSNDKDDYLRNYIRHHVTPALQQAAINANISISNSIQHLAEDAALLHELVHKKINEISICGDNKTIINKVKLIEFNNAVQLLFMYLKEYGFNYAQANDMLKNKANQSGKIFYSNSHRILLNRNEIILTEFNNAIEHDEIMINDTDQIIETPLKMQINKLVEPSNNYKQASANEAYLDSDKMVWPLKLRRWQSGDSMQTLGMKHRRKISDILIDLKVDVLAKEKVYVLTDACGEILWLIGYRISETCKITNRTNNIMHLKAGSKLH